MGEKVQKSGRVIVARGPHQRSILVPLPVHKIMLAKMAQIRGLIRA